MFFSFNYFAIVIIILEQFFDLRKCEESNQWTVIFYTGTRIFSGTSADIYIQLHGTKSSSDVIYLKPNTRKERASVYKYYTNIYKDIGTLKKLTIGLSQSYPLLSDWELEKAEIIDPKNVTYTFFCDCWLKFSNPRRTISVTPQNNQFDNDLLFNSPRSQYPLTIGLLTMLTFLIIFAYITNSLCKKWRARLNSFTYNDRNIRLTPMTLTSIVGAQRNEQMNLDANQNIRAHLFNDKFDKPPEYKDLFPAPNNSIANNNQQNPITKV